MQLKFWGTITIVIVLICFVLLLDYTRKEFHGLKASVNAVQETTEHMSAGIGYNMRRKKTVLSLYNKIIEQNPKLPKDLAFKIADYDFYVAAEIYKSFDPFLLFAIQWKETGGSFDPNLTSPAGAKGLNQLMPLTAKWMTKGMKWEWSDDYLTNPFRNTDIAANYLDFLFSNLKNEKLVLAYYNGGEQQYKHALNGRMDLVCVETSNYIKKVQEYAEEMRKLDNIRDTFVPSITDSVRVESRQVKKPKIEKPESRQILSIDTIEENG